MVLLTNIHRDEASLSYNCSLISEITVHDKTNQLTSMTSYIGTKYPYIYNKNIKNTALKELCLLLQEDIGESSYRGNNKPFIWRQPNRELCLDMNSLNWFDRTGLQRLYTLLPKGVACLYSARRTAENPVIGCNISNILLHFTLCLWSPQSSP